MIGKIKSCLERPKTLVFFGVFDVVNLTLTVTFLIVPYWFYHAGLLFGIVSLSLSLVLGGISSFWVLEVSARAGLLFRNKDYSLVNDESCKIDISIDPDRKFEFNELAKIVIGKIASFIISLIVTTSAILFMFSGIIPGSQALAVNIPINTTIFTACSSEEFDVAILPGGNCLNWYRLMVTIFGIVGTVLACLRGKDQIYVIVFLSILRLLVMCYMICFSIFVIRDEISNATIPTNFVTDFDLSKSMLATGAFFTFIYLPTLVPSVTHSITIKSSLRPLIIISFLFLAIFLSMYGSVLSFAFGSNIHQNSILNLQPYTMNNHSSALRVMSHIILLYPCLDGISSFMYGVILASNQTFTLFIGKDFSEVSKVKRYKILNLIIYVCFSIFPIIICLFISNIGTILDISGLIIFVSNIIIPALLQIFSTIKCRKLFSSILPKTRAWINNSIFTNAITFLFESTFPTPYSSLYSSYFMVIAITLISTIFFSLSFVFLIVSFF